MHYPAEYIAYLCEFHGTRDYFECHEILEEYWKGTTERDRRSIWVGLIQLAVSQYHHRRGNLNGALKTMEKSIDILSSRKESLSSLGLNAEQLETILKEAEQRIKEETPYQSLRLPIKDPGLIASCREECLRNGYSWDSKETCDPEVIHRHKSRDRTDVIAERERQHQLRIAGRSGQET